MPEYKILIKNPDGGRDINFSVILTGSDEDYPQDYFKRENISSRLREAIKSQSYRDVSQENLKLVINEWLKEIKNNRRLTSIKVNLDIGTANRTDFQPEISIPKKEINPPQTGHNYTAKRPDPNLRKGKNVNDSSDLHTQAESPEKKESNKEPIVSVESNSNEPDF
jgi:hypothetical protein